MDTVNILNQMEQYDFSTPINVTIFEDSDEESPIKNRLREWRRNSTNKENETSCEVEQTTEKHNNNSISEKSAPLANNHGTSINTKENNTIATVISISGLNINSNSNEVMSNQTSNIKNNSADNNGDKSTHLNKLAELSEQVEPLLDIVSEHLVLIASKFYNLYNQFNDKDTTKAREIKSQFFKFKSHIFDLSYSIVVSLILPQENNDIFLDRLFNKTVADANKVLSWTCSRKHIEPFYIDMIRWVKLKKKSLPKLGPKSNNDQINLNMNTTQNRLLKAMLNDSVSTPNTVSASKELAIGRGAPTDKNFHCPSNQVLNNNNTDNSLCIFSSGSAGRNVSISINPNMLTNQPRHQYRSMPPNSTNLVQVNNNNCIINSAVPQNYDLRRNPMEQNSYSQSQTIHHRPVTQRPPPQYDAIHHRTSNAAIPNYKTISQVNDEIALSLQNYQIQQNLAASANAKSHFGQMYHTPVENMPTITPVITHVTSLHANNMVSIPTNGRCCVCGINTNLRCSRCNNFSYCSTLCQELDAGLHNTVCPGRNKN